MYIDNAIPLNEMQFGKTNSLLAIEDLFDKFRLKYGKKDASQNVKHFREIIKDETLKKIGKYIAKAFGFNEVLVTLSRDKSINAYTVPFPRDKKGNAYTYKEKALDDAKFRASVVIDNGGFSYNLNKFPTNFLVCITTGLMFDKKISSGEIVAVLLHEIGHTFSKVIVSKTNLTPRADEAFADQFAAMYGYGVEFTSVMQKMHIGTDDPNKLSEKLKKVPLINIIYGTASIAKKIMYREVLRDEHPGLKRRLDSQIDQMESDLKDYKEIMSPEMKDALKKKIEECRRMNDAFFDTSNDNMYDTMQKWYWNNLEPNLPANKNMDIFARKGTDPDRLNTQLGNMYKKKGYFRK